MRLKRIIVTGANGFIGQFVCRRLARRGFQIVPLAREPSWTMEFLHRFLHETQPDAILHLASASPSASADEHQISRQRGLSLLSAVRKYRPGALFIAMGSAAEHGDALRADRAMTEDDPCVPNSLYSRAKFELTSAIQNGRTSERDAISLRLFTAVGPDMPTHLLLGRVAHQLKSSPSNPITVGSLSSARDYVNCDVITDAISAVILSTGPLPCILNLASGDATSVRDIVLEMIALEGRPRAIQENSDQRSTGLPRIWGDNTRLQALNIKVESMTPRRIAMWAMADGEKV